MVVGHCDIKRLFAFFLLVLCSMSPFRSMKKNSPNSVDPNGHGHHGSTNGAGSSGIPSSGYGSLIRPKSSSLRKNNSNSDILSR